MEAELRTGMDYSSSTVATLLLAENVNRAKLKICVLLLENCELDSQIVAAKRRN